MARREKTKDLREYAETAPAKPEARLEDAEDHLEKAAHGAEASFYKRGAKADARLEDAEDHLEKAAQKANASGHERASEAGRGGPAG